MDLDSLTRAVKKELRGFGQDIPDNQRGSLTNTVIGFDVENGTVELTERGTPLGTFDENGRFIKAHACYTTVVRNSPGFPRKRAADIADELYTCQENAYFSNQD